MAHHWSRQLKAYAHLQIGGKVLSSRTKRSANRARHALEMAAMSLPRSDSALGAFYRRVSAPTDKPQANTATAQKPARGV